MKLTQKIKEFFTGKENVAPTQNKNYSISSVNDKPHFFTDNDKCDKATWFDIYNLVGEPQVVLGKKADMLSNLSFVLKNKKGEIVETHPIYKLLDKPNPVQSLPMFLKDWLVNLEVTGEAFIYSNKTLRGTIPSTMYVLNSTEVSVDYNDTLPYYLQTDIDGLIRSYSHAKNILEKSNVCHVLQPDPEHFLHPLSTIKKIVKNINITDSTYTTKNTLYRNKGAIGILSTKSSDMDAGGTMTVQERKRIEQAYRDSYGIEGEKSKVIISDSEVTWQPMTYPVKDLDMTESRLTDFMMCIDAFGMDRNVFSHTEGSTFANLKDGMKASYINTVIPLAYTFAYELTRFFGLDTQGLYLDVDTTSVAWLKGDEVQEKTADKLEVETLLSLYQADAISLQELRKRLNM